MRLKSIHKSRVDLTNNFLNIYALWVFSLNSTFQINMTSPPRYIDSVTLTFPAFSSSSFFSSNSKATVIRCCRCSSHKVGLKLSLSDGKSTAELEIHDRLNCAIHNTTFKHQQNLKSEKSAAFLGLKFSEISDNN